MRIHKNVAEYHEYGNNLHHVYTHDIRHIKIAAPSRSFEGAAVGIWRRGHAHFLEKGKT